MNDFLSKPVRLRDLEAELERALLAPDAEAVHGAIDPARLDELFEDDHEAVKDVLQLAITACRTSMDRLEREIPSRNADGAASAHQLRGTAFNLGADALAQRAGLLQAEISGERWAAAARLLEECQLEFARVRADAVRMYDSTPSAGRTC